MKILMKILSCFLVFSIFLFCSGCKNSSEPNSNATKKYYSKLGYYEVCFEDKINYECENSKIVKIDSTTIMAKPKTKIKLFMNTNNGSSKDTDVQHETINFSNSTFLAGFSINNEIISFSNASSGVSITSDTVIKISYAKFKIKGVAIYQILQNNQNKDEFLENDLFIQSQVIKTENTFQTSNNFLSFVYYENGIHQNNIAEAQSNSTFKIKTLNNSSFEMCFEIFAETLSTYSFLILEDSFNNVYLYSNKIETLATNQTIYSNTNSSNFEIANITIKTSFDLTTEEY